MVFKDCLELFIVKYIELLDFDSIPTKITYTFTVLLSVVFLQSRMKFFNYTFFLSSICVTVIYILFRTGVVEHAGWDFASLLFDIKYADVIFLPPVISIIPYVKSKIRKNESESELLHKLSDHCAIDSINDDLFGFAQSAESLLNVLIQNKSRTEKGAIVIGLNAKWGKGKTSFMNLMRCYALRRDDIILIRLNVWQTCGYKDMVKVLLSSIANGIGDVTLKGLIDDYSKIVINADISYLSKFAALLFGNNQKRPEELFDAVSDRIRTLNKTIIVQVDDLDRLAGREIFYALKFIRNVAGFKNTFFIVAYDEEYIRKQLNKFNIDSSYLEKIFNVIYPLPSLSKNEYIDLIKQELVNSILLENNVDDIVDVFLNTIDGNITFRNAKRLASSVMCSVSLLRDKDGIIMVDLLDYMLLQYLQQINQKAYDFLENFNDTSFWGSKCIRQSGGVVLLNKDKGLKDRLTDDEYKELLIKDVGVENIDLVYKIFHKLFDYSRNKALGFKFTRSYPVYFKRVFDEKLISQREFDNSIGGGVEHFKDDLVKWYQDYDNIILDRLISFHLCKTAEEWLQFLNSILCITPKSYTEFWKKTDKNKKFIPTPGSILISEGTLNERRVFIEACNIFFLDKNIINNDIETIQKKFALLVYNNEYINLYDYQSNNKINKKAVFHIYWKLYWQNLNSYNDFNEDFWYYLFLLQREGYFELGGLVQNHIKNNIDDFIIYYPVSEIKGSTNFHSVFSVSICDGKYVEGDWKINFKNFLESIKDKSDALIKYITEYDNYIKS